MLLLVTLLINLILYKFVLFTGEITLFKKTYVLIKHIIRLSTSNALIMTLGPLDKKFDDVFDT